MGGMFDNTSLAGAKQLPFPQRISRAIRSHSLLLLFLFAGASVIFVSIYSRIVINFFVQASEANVRDKLRESALRLAMITAPEELDPYREPSDAKKEGYKALRQKLIGFAADSNLAYAYYLRVVGDKLQFIADNDEDLDTRVGIDTGMEDLSDNPDLQAAIEKRGVSVTPLGQYVPGWQGLISAYAPIFDNNGEIAAFAGVDINDEEIVASHDRQDLLLRLMLASVLLVIGSGAYGFHRYRRQAELAEKVSGAKSRFLSRMSHEIRAPMNAVIGMSDLVAMNYGTPQGLEYISQIKQASNNLLAIINDILDLSAVEAGKISLREAPYETASLLSDAITIVRIKLKDKKDIKFSYEIDSNLPGKITGDETRVREILLNLLTNAVKYTFKGFVKLKVSGIRESNTSLILTFEVCDSGIGIRPKDLTRIFSDFSRADNKYISNIEGAGLGLSIARMFCRRMGGDVKVESKYGAGSKFTASVIQSCQAECSPIGRFEEKTTTTVDLFETNYLTPDFRVLIVDDLPTNIKAVEGLLAPYHMKVDACLSGKESIKMVQNQEYGLVLLDHMMPEMDGFEAVAAIRSLPGKHYKELPIVALTANVVAGMKELFLSHGFDDFLAKPIEIPKLATLIEKWVPIEKRVYADRSRATGQRLFEQGVLPERRAVAERRITPDRRFPAVAGNIPGGMLGSALQGIEGLDLAQGYATAGGTPEAYREVLKIFCRDVADWNKSFDIASPEKDSNLFAVHTHALKSALASIGALALSTDANGLEEATLRKDFKYTADQLGNFSAALSKMYERIINALKAREPPQQGNISPIAASVTDAAIISVLKELKSALCAEDARKSDQMLDRLPSLPLDGDTKEALARVSDLVLNSGFEEAAKLIAGILAKAGHGETSAED